jgi:hypothetical protein
MTIRHRYSFRAFIVLLLEAALFFCPLFPVHAVWQTFVDGTSFTSVSAFQKYWAYNYPWAQTTMGALA